MLIPPTDIELVRTFRQGDDRAFGELYQRYQHRATAYAQRVIKSPQDAEEVVTEAFIKVVDGSFSPTGSFRSYLFTVVRRLCVDRLRRQNTRGRAVHLLRERDPAPDLDAHIDALRDQERVERAMQQLSEVHRSVLLLYYQQGMSCREVADVMTLSEQQVRSKLAYARQTLKKLLHGACS